MAAKCRVVTRFRNTIGLPGRLSVRLQPNHPTDDPQGIAASTLDGLLLGAGDAVIGVNPATDSVAATVTLLTMLDTIRERYDIPTQTCVLAHVTTQLARHRGRRAGRPGVPVDRRHPGREPQFRHHARPAARGARRSTVAAAAARSGDNVMYFETGQGCALSAGAHHGVDQQTCEARAYAVARALRPAAGQHRRRLHRAGIPVRRQADHPRRAGGSFLRQAAWPADGVRRLLHQPRRGGPGRHGHAADPAWRRRRHLRDGRARARTT